MNWQASDSDMVSVLWFLGAKSKFGRAPGACAGCVEPLEATWNQDNSFPDNPFHGLFKIEDNHVFSANFVLNAKYAYYGTGFELTPDRRPRRAGRHQRALRAGRSAPRSSRRTCGPQHTVNVDASYFANGWGGNHEIKFGGGWRKTEALTQTLWPGDQVVAYDTTLANQRARVNREGLGINQTYYWSAYLGDTFSKDRLTFNVGVRWDRQGGTAVASDVQSATAPSRTWCPASRSPATTRRSPGTTSRPARASPTRSTTDARRCCAPTSRATSRSSTRASSAT